MSPKPSRDTICAAIVTYHPDSDFPSRVLQIAAQVGAVVMVDNCSGSQAHEMLASLAEQPSIFLVSNSANLGIATALNQGARWAFERGYSYLLTFDQDSVIFANMIDVYAEIYSEVSSKGEIAIIGTNYLRSVDGQIAIKIKPKAIPPGTSGTWSEAVTQLTSGTLLPRTVWDKIGSFRDEFFIDGVDEEYCLRARTQGIRIVISTTPLMQHTVGEQRSCRLLWSVNWAHNYSPLRHYCRSRNSVAIYRAFLRHEPRWVISHMRFNAQIFMKVCLYEPQKAQKLRSISLGLLDGLRSRFDLLAVRIS